MGSVRFKYRSGVQYDLRRHPTVVEFLEDKGRSIVNEANSTLDDNFGYRMSSKQGRKRPQGRWAVRVYTASNYAKRSNAKNNTLVRLLGSVREM